MQLKSIITASIIAFLLMTSSSSIAALKVVMSDDITARVPKNSLMTKNNTVEAQRVDINN